MARGLKNKDLAEKMETSDANISRLLNGERQITLDWLRDFAKALELPMWQLLMPPEDAEIYGEKQVKTALRRIRGLPEEAVNPLWRLISGYVEDAE